MRIRALHLTAFGPFAGRNLDFSGPSFHLIHGDNEAGKSTTLRAVLAFFFGFNHRGTPEAFAHEGLGIRLGATIATDAGEMVTLYRFRQGARVDRVTDATDTPWSQERFAREILGGVNEAFFLRFLGLDHETLRTGGRELAQAKGELGQALFSAASGLPGMEKNLKRLETEAEELFKVRGQNQVINRLLKQMEGHQRQMRDASWNHHTYQDQAKEQESIAAEKGALDRELDEVEIRLQRLLRLQKALPLLKERTRLEKSLEALQDAILLPEETGEKRGRIEEGLKTGKRDLISLEKEQNQVTSALEQLGPVSPITEEEEEISALNQGVKAWETSRKKEEQLTREKEQKQESKQKLLSDFDLTREPAIPSRRERARIREKVENHQKLVEEEARTEQEWQRAVARLEASPPLPFPGSSLQERAAFRAILNKLRGLGEVETRIAQGREEARKIREQGESRAVCLPLWGKGYDALALLPLPSREWLLRWENEQEGHLGEEKRLSEEISRQHKELRDNLDELDIILGPGLIPLPEELSQARRERDRLWRLVCRSWRHGEEAEPMLEERFEEALALSDQVADRRLEYADRVAKAATLTARGEKLRERLEETRGEFARVEEVVKKWREAWRSEWSFLSAPPFPPREMGDWCLQVEEIRAQVAVATRLEEETRLLAEQWRVGKEEIARHWPGGEFPQDYSLAALLEAGESLLRELERQETEAEQRREVRNSLTLELAQAEKKRDSAKANVTAFLGEWENLDPWLEGEQIPPGRMAIYLPFWEELEKIHGDLGRIEEERMRLGEEISRFARQAETLSARLLPDQTGEPVERQVRALHLAWIQARDREQKRAHLVESRETLTHRIRQRQEELAGLVQEWNELLALAGCEDGDGLSQAMTRSASRREWTTRWQNLLERLSDLAGSEGVAELARRAGEVDEDALPREMARLQEERERIRGEREKRQKAGWEIEAKLAAAPQEEAAEGHALEYRLIQGELAGEAGRYLVLRLAHLLAERGFHRFRERRKNPMVERAGQFFSRLTLGSFRTLEAVNDDKGGSLMVGIRPPGTKVLVEGMSDGARDQLFLSLRLAAIEAHFVNHPPLPLILDDLLIHFDDSRVKVALEILGEFSEKTQVLFFTHHQRIRELAREVFADRMGEHELRPLL